MKVYTCTMNLAIDLFIETDVLVPDKVNRTNADEIQANGKGVNVSLVMKHLGVESKAIGFSGGFSGAYIESYLKSNDILTNFIPVEGMTRINVFTQVINEENEYKLVNRGPIIKESEESKLLKFISTIESGSYLVVSGSLPRGLSDTVLSLISKICYANKVNIIIDSSSQAVLDCLQYEPFLLKPNIDELGAWCNQPIKTGSAAIEAAQLLIAKGAKNVLLSMGDKGAYFITPKKVYTGNAPQGKVINTAGAGDTLLATFLAEYLKEELSISDILKKAIAAGSSTAFSKGLTDFKEVDALSSRIVIEELDWEETTQIK